MEKKLPHYIHIGPQRTGTTWLYNVLLPHVHFPHGTKETMFFDGHYRKGIGWYASHFRCSDNTKPLMEIAPTYFSSVRALEGIKKHMPDCKILCTLRDPVDRLYSLYKLMREYGMTRLSFEDAIRKHPEMLESNRYAFYVDQWMRSFGRANMSIMVYDELKESPQKYFGRICSILGIEPVVLEPSQLNNTEKESPARNYLLAKVGQELSWWFRSKRLYWLLDVAKRLKLRRVFFGGGADFPPINHETECTLRKQFIPEIEELEKLLGLDLGRWKRKDL